MIEFITLITLLCSHQEYSSINQVSCTKRLFKACTQKQLVTNKIVMKDASCLVENL